MRARGLRVDDLSNAVAQAVEHNIGGTMALPHPYGRLQFGADLQLHFRTLIGPGSNPNVAAVVQHARDDRSVAHRVQHRETAQLA